MITSPSSLENGPLGQDGKRSNTASLGRHKRTPRSVHTIGRSTKIGSLQMAVRRSSPASNQLTNQRQHLQAVVKSVLQMGTIANCLCKPPHLLGTRLGRSARNRLGQQHVLPPIDAIGHPPMHATHIHAEGRRNRGGRLPSCMTLIACWCITCKNWWSIARPSEVRLRFIRVPPHKTHNTF